MRVWRICRAIHVAGAFSGEGARLFGGRWNSPGVKVVYTSTSLALAAVETFVHIEPNLQPDDLVSMEVTIPESLSIERLDPKILPKKWHERRDESLRTFGDDWIRKGAGVALYVPSAAVRGEWNMLLNPGHADMRKIKIGKPKRFEFDLRMFREKR
jgi:RES domain-containing protein